MQKRPIWAVWAGTENFPHVGTQEAVKTPPIQLDHLHVFGLESGSTQSETGGRGGSRYPLLGFTTYVGTVNLRDGPGAGRYNAMLMVSITTLVVRRVYQ